MSFYVYILKCCDGSYYTGHTDNIQLRMAQHQQGTFPKCYTASRLPVELVFTQQFPTREEALASERRIKGWSRKKKEAMMRGDWNEVSRLAQNALRRAQALRQAQGDRGQDVLVSTKIIPPVRGEPVEPQNQALRQAQDNRRESVHAEPVEAKTHDNRSIRALRPFDPSMNSGLMAQGDRTNVAHGDDSQKASVRGEPRARRWAEPHNPKDNKK